MLEYASEKYAMHDAKQWRSRFALKRKRRLSAWQLLGIIVALGLLYHLIVHDTPSSTSMPTMKFMPASYSAPSEVAVDMPRNTGLIILEKFPVQNGSEPDPTLGKSATGPPGIAGKEAERKDADRVKVSRTELNATLLHQLLTLLPDEMQFDSLLRPIEATGAERLRDLGLRTRHFEELFKAWERVHLVPTGDELYIRDDVIQYLQRHSQIAQALDMNTTELIRSYDTYRSFITRLSNLLFPWTAPHFPDHIHLHAQLYNGGRGLVFSAGDDQAPFLLTSIPAIRKLGCELPIEIMYLGDNDLSQDTRAHLELLPGVTTRDLSQMVNDKGWTLTGWAGKPFAILFSSFREAIFIDADSLFLQNPELLFEDPMYQQTGALFFKDRLMMPESKKRWLQEVLPKPISRKAMESRLWTGQSAHMQESGVVVVDKWRHFVALLLVTRMNGPDRDGNAVLRKVGVYDMVYGDKETFWLGWELIGDLDYAFHDGDAGIMGALEQHPTMKAQPSQRAPVTSSPGSPDELTGEPERYTICAPQLLHLDRSGRPLWFNGWLLPNKFDRTKRQEPIHFEAFLTEPREIQDPDAWQLRENNICCLTSKHKQAFNLAEKQVLEMIIDIGQQAGVLD